VNNFIL